MVVELSNEERAVILAAATAIWVFACASVAARATLRSSRRVAPPDALRAHALLLRPCAGYEPGLTRALQSSLSAGRSWQTRLLVESEQDGAYPHVARVQQTLAACGRDVGVVITHARGPNRKVDQLARALSAFPDPPPIVVVADSDVVLSEVALSELLTPILQGEADATWAPPIEMDASTLADVASQAILDASLHSFPLLAQLDPEGMVGKLFAIRRDALEDVGGFGALVGYLGEDMELARRLKSRGLRARATQAPAVSRVHGRSYALVLRRYARWILVIRAQRPKLLPSYPLLFAAAPLQAICAAISLGVDGLVGIALFIAVVGVRSCVAVVARRRCHRSLSGILFAPWLADALLLAAFACALGSRKLQWRGVNLRVERGGTLTNEIPT